MPLTVRYDCRVQWARYIKTPSFCRLSLWGWSAVNDARTCTLGGRRRQDIGDIDRAKIWRRYAVLHIPAVISLQLADFLEALKLVEAAMYAKREPQFEAPITNAVEVAAEYIKSRNPLHSAPWKFEHTAMGRRAAAALLRGGVGDGSVVGGISTPG